MSFSEISPYFSWIIDKLLAVSALPYHHTHLKYFRDNGIHTIISITDSNEPPFHTISDLKVIKLTTLQSGILSIADLNYFVNLVEIAKSRREGVLIHSVNGTGRSGCLVAAYLIKAWESPANYVITHLRLIRPVSIENTEQESLIYKYYDSISSGFDNNYLKKETKWSSQTEFLGKDRLENIVDYQTFPEHYQERIELN